MADLQKTYSKIKINREYDIVLKLHFNYLYIRIFLINKLKQKTLRGYMKLTKLITTAGLGLILSACSGLGKSSQVNVSGTKMMVLGYLHKVSVENKKYSCIGKLDSGADNCSMGATNITPFERDGEKWVRFDLDKRLTNGKKVTLEKKVVKTTEIARHGQTPQKRFVVKLDFTLAGIQQKINVSLTDRSEYSKAILVGRNFLNGYILVDSTPITDEVN